MYDNQTHQGINIFIMSIFGSGVITSHDQYIVITKWDDPMYMTDFKRSLTLASTVIYSNHALLNLKSKKISFTCDWNTI
jgi:hypothetical protein